MDGFNNRLLNTTKEIISKLPRINIARQKGWKIYKKG